MALLGKNPVRQRLYVYSGRKYDDVGIAFHLSAWSDPFSVTLRPRACIVRNGVLRTETLSPCMGAYVYV